MVLFLMAKTHKMRSAVSQSCLPLVWVVFWSGQQATGPSRHLEVPQLPCALFPPLHSLVAGPPRGSSEECLSEKVCAGGKSGKENGG